MPGQPDYDCLIIGGGLVGATLAFALGDTDLRIGVIEAVPFKTVNQSAYDDRGLSLAPSSQRILSGLGLWDAVQPDACPIRQIHVSERGGFGFVHISADKLGVDALGHIVLGRTLGRVIVEGAMQKGNVDWHCPAHFVSSEADTSMTRVRVEQDGEEREMTTRLLIIADGAQSSARDHLGIETQQKDYAQTAIVATVTPSRPHGGTAYERFTPDGPLALLPLDAERCVVVWTASTDEAQQILTLDDQAFMAGLEQRFGRRLGGFVRVGCRNSYPLRLIQAKTLCGHRYLVIGNAAHAIHPNAAQGLNLGLRDVAAVSEYIQHAIQEGQDIGGLDGLEKLSAAMAEDHRRIIRFSDGLTQIFYNDFLPLALLRNSAMWLFDCLPFAKRRLARLAMGLSGSPPALVRGIRP
jgi:2-octaprenyl-6-methoxyphenol hydroxylase